MNTYIHYDWVLYEIYNCTLYNNYVNFIGVIIIVDWTWCIIVIYDVEKDFSEKV